MSVSYCSPVVLLGLVFLVVVRAEDKIFLSSVQEHVDHRRVEGKAVEEQRVNKTGHIPRQLVFTSKDGSINALPPAIQKNLAHTLEKSPGFSQRLLSDAECLDFIKKHYDEGLAKAFAEEPQGSYRGDICRTAVLAEEGGFYFDLDLELKDSPESLMDTDTTFVSAFDNDKAVYNALLGSEPHSPIMREAIEEIRRWYNGEVPHFERDSGSQALGPVSTLRALRTVAQAQCPGGPDHPDNELQRDCGEQNIRMYWELPLSCKGSDAKYCSEDRKENAFDGVHYGIFKFPKPKKDELDELVGWSRIATCSTWGCKTGGADKTPSPSSQV